MEVRRFDHPYSEFLDRVEKPTRYTGREHGVHIKNFDEVQARVCLAFPDVYDIGMSHLGYRILYQLLNADPRTLAERCYAPWIDLEQELRTRKLPLVSLENRKPLSAFDVVGFSLQFELCHTNVLTMLELGGIALRSSERDDKAPLVIAGGPVATHPEPVAPFFDAIVIGDGEEVLTQIALSWVEGKRLGLSRKERLVRLSQLPGVYVPSLYETERDALTGLEVVAGTNCADAPLPVRRHFVKNLADYPFPTTGPVGGPEAVFDRMSIEVARGCTEGCRFCQAGMIYRPVRERPPSQVMDAVLGAVSSSGQDEISLTALSTADVSYISPLLKALSKKTAPERISVGVASLRAYGLGEELLDELRKVRAAGLTFAPEAGSQRLRDAINKNVTEEQLLETAERVFSRGWDRMKLYFILGLPTETDEDLEGIIQCGRRTLDVARRVSRKRVTVTVSVSVHVPKPHTPFQWCAMDQLAEIRRKQQLLRQMARGIRGLELKVHESIASVLEGIIARGDRRLADVIEHAYRNGARFDSWDDQFLPDVWAEAFEHLGIDRNAYLGEIPLNARLPWSHIDVGLEPGFLPREYQRALGYRTSPPCSKPLGMNVHHTNVADAESDTRKLVCYHCGLKCNLDELSATRRTHLVSLGALHAPAPYVRPQHKEPVLSSDTASPNSSAEGAPLTEAPEMAPGQEVIPLCEEADHPEVHRPNQVGERATLLRMRFTKTGTASLLGHLDLIRELPRCFRRAGIRVAYTKGFHPKPHLSFAPALSLGVLSLDEFVDATLLDAPGRDELLARLSTATCPGISFIDAGLLPERAPSLSKCIGAARYALVVPTSLVQSIGGIAAVKERIQSFLAEEQVVISRRVDRSVKKVDVRKHVQTLDIASDSVVSDTEQAGISGDYLTLELVISLTPQGSSKATEVGLALFGEAGEACRAVRVALLDEDGQPLSRHFRGERFEIDVKPLPVQKQKIPPEACEGDAGAPLD